MPKNVSVSAAGGVGRALSQTHSSIWMKPAHGRRHNASRRLTRRLRCGGWADAYPRAAATPPHGSACNSSTRQCREQYTAVQGGAVRHGHGAVNRQPGEASLAVVRDDRMVRPGISPTIRSDPIRSDPIRSDPIRSDPIRSDQAAKV